MTDASASDVELLALSLRERYPTRELLLLLLRSLCPIEAEMFAGDLVDDHTLHTSAARTLVALGITVLPDRTEALESAPDIQRFSTFGLFFSACVDELAVSQSLRVTLVGPTFLEPIWLHKRSEPTRTSPDFTMALRKRLYEGSLVCEMILRNNEVRYLLNLREFIRSAKEWERLIDDMLKDSYRLFGSHGEKGPRIRCFDPGFASPLHIFDKCVLIGTRRTAAERVRGGWRIRRPEMVTLELERWSMLFDEAPQNQQVAVETLREFLDDLRTKF